MDARIRVGDVMTRDFIHVNPESSVLECAKTMTKKRVGSIIVKEGDKLHGIITEKDLVWAMTKKPDKLREIKAKEVLTKKLVTISPEATIHQALDKMNKKKIRRLPVVNNKKIVGYVTLKDIVKFMPELFEENREFERIREESEKIEKSELASKGTFHENICEECGNFDILFDIDGRMICEFCKDQM
ncbi:CBS domain-containing protein [Candidatus Pacearchaeota archaeon]|nr:CBS domain-containing protein [Candidatus Pacearchaeota archaeon]